MKLLRVSRRSTSAASLLMLGSLALVLSSCTSVKKEYASDASQQTARGKSLEVPPDLIVPGRDDRLQMPNDPRRTTASSYNNDSKAQAQSGVANSPDQIGKAHIARAGSQRWLVLPGTPQVVWPQLRKFWEDLGFTIATDSPQLYVMETDWAEKRARNSASIIDSIALIRSFVSNAEKDKFRTRLETSTEPGMVEIYVSHRGLEETDLSDKLNEKANGWQTKPGDPSLELEMLRRMMVAFGATEEQAKFAVAAPAAPDKAHLSNAENGALALNLDGALDSAWRQVGLALDRVGMVVEDRDRAKGYYFVRYVTDEDLGKKKESWFSWMAFWRSNKKPDTDQFRIVVQRDGEKTVVRVQNKAGEAASPASTKQILTLLYNELK
ncbi:MAG: nlpB [Rhodocyclales bacterium]|nr:nlpB [Rhodocyclales bacterium]